VRRAEIEKSDAEKEQRRWEDLEKTGAVSDSDLDSIRRRSDLADVALAEATVYLSKCILESPVRGIVDDRYVESGEYVAEGAPLFRVVEVDTVKMVIDVPEQDVLAAEAGREVPFTVSAYPDRTFTGRVSFVSLVASSGSNSFRTEVLVGNADGSLRPGMITEASLVRGTRERAAIVPFSSVVPEKGEHVVYVAEEDRAVRRLVKIDTMLGHEVVLSSGVEAGDALVVDGQRGLQDGALVDVVEERPADG
jgi:membrane fusion protein (multidrug efflux system)